MLHWRTWDRFDTPDDRMIFYTSSVYVVGPPLKKVSFLSSGWLKSWPLGLLSSFFLGGGGVEN